MPCRGFFVEDTPRTPTLSIPAADPEPGALGRCFIYPVHPAALRRVAASVVVDSGLCLALEV